MKRTTTALSAFAAGAALLLAGCGSDTSGSAAPATSAAAQAASPTSASDTSSEVASTEDSTSPISSADDSTSETSSANDSTSESSSDGTSTVDTSATTTVGGASTLDDTSTQWFTTYCSGLAPALDQVKNLSSTMTSAGSDPKALMKKLAPLFSTMGSAFTKTAKSLDGVPVPTFNGGDTLAKTVTTAMNEFGPKFTELGSALSKGDAAAMSKLQDLSKDISGLQELARFKVDARTLSAIKEIPSCAPLFSMAG